MSADRLVCSYPGPAVEIASSTANKPDFWSELSSFLVQMDREALDSAPLVSKAGSKVQEIRDTAHPHYICSLLVNMLRGMGGNPENVVRVTKHIIDDVLWDKARLPWRRSGLWLILRVALQTSLPSRVEYKSFMVSYLAELLSIAVNLDFPSTTLHAMSAKVAQRFHKIHEEASEKLGQSLIPVVKRSRELTESRWRSTQIAESPLMPFQASKLDPLHDTSLTLPHSRDYLLQVLRNEHEPPSPSHYRPKESTRLRSSDLTAYAHGELSAAIGLHGLLALADFEAAVRLNIDNWATKNYVSESACGILASCFDQYLTAAKSYYKLDAVDKSIQILTLMELWMAVDKLACAQHPLLAQYPPEVPSSFLTPLLLRTRAERERSLAMEKYLAARWQHSTRRTSLFANISGDDHFSVQSFRVSPELQHLKTNIEKIATRERTAKRAELHRLNKEYHRLIRQANALSCEYYTDGWQSRHSYSCTKCSYQQEAQNLTIQVHEWPLSHNRLLAEASVFELRCPEAVSVWRNLTYQLLSDIGLPSRQENRVSQIYILEQYPGLRAQGRFNEWNRITLASTAKPFIASHYGNQPIDIPVEEGRVLLNNGLQFQMYDKHYNTWSSGSLAQSNISSYGTIDLAKGSAYHYLQYALKGTQHTSNQVLADQADCPKALSLHEHYAFGTLRAGGSIQWMNILRELASNGLRFQREEVASLVTMAIWQIGPSDPSFSRRCWHVSVGEEDFAPGLLTEADNLLNNIQASWLNLTAVRILSEWSPVLQTHQCS